MIKNIIVTGANTQEIESKLKQVLEGKNIQVIHSQNYFTDNGQVSKLVVYNEIENTEGGEN